MAIMDRYIAFDIGDRRIGIAVSDPFNSYALPSHTYWRKGLSEDIPALIAVAKEKGATAIVCGLPLNSDGTESRQTEKTRFFIEKLKEATDLPVFTADERYTSAVAHEQLYASGRHSEQHKNYVDALAAASILDGFLSTLKNKQGDKTMDDEELYDGEIPEDDELTDDEILDEDEDQIIELIDDEGNVVKFRLFDVTEYKGEKYTLLLAAEPNEEFGEDEVVIFRLNEKEEALEPIEDEALLQEIFDFYVNEEDELN